LGAGTGGRTVPDGAADASIVATGTAAELKSQVGKRAVHVTLTTPQGEIAAGLAGPVRC